LMPKLNDCGAKAKFGALCKKSKQDADDQSPK